jgi:hypothetical protein
MPLFPLVKGVHADLRQHDDEGGGKAWMPTSVGTTDGVNRRVCINAGWYETARRAAGDREA